MNLINAALSHSRTVLLFLALLLISGTVSWFSLPRESTPDITVPFVYVSIPYEGISPEDADRLLVSPVMQELQGLDGIKQIDSSASEGHASLTLEFYINTDIDKAVMTVRNKVDQARSKLPDGVDEPTVNEINLALFPVLVIALSGDLEERILIEVARDLSDRLEAIPGVLEAGITGDREEVAEIIIDPTLMESYQLSQAEIFQWVSENNKLVAAGSLDTGTGRFPLKVPGLIENEADILSMPVKARGADVVRFSDVAFGQRTYKDPQNYARVNGQPTVTLEISKRIGSNIIHMNAAVRAVVEAASKQWPEGITITYSQDQSREIINSVNDLVNNVAFATLLVMIVIVASLGLRSSLLVGLAIPGSFLTALLALSLMGYTLNIVVLFSLILAVGMLVDGAIVVVEYADRRMGEGKQPRFAFAEAANRMAWPITASTATTLAVFMPLLFWPDITGEFMKYLPITMLITLTASLFMALIAIPTLGTVLVRSAASQPAGNPTALEQQDVSRLSGMTGSYVRTLHLALRYPGWVISGTIASLILMFYLYGALGNGVEFFPEAETDASIISVRARGDLSLDERDKLVREVEQRLLPMDEIKVIYTSVNSGPGQRGEPLDIIGSLQLELQPWHQRRHQHEILRDIRLRTADIPGIIIEAQQRQEGPSQGRDIQLALASYDIDTLSDSIDRVITALHEMPGLTDIQDTRPLPGIEWQVEVDRTEAARYGANIGLVGNMVQLITHGLKVGEYRAAGSDEEIEIRLRYPGDYRHLAHIDAIRVQTEQGSIPISHFISLTPKPKTGNIARSNNFYAMKVEANVQEGFQQDKLIAELTAQLPELLHAGVNYEFQGDQEQQEESAAFLLKAFGAAIFIMAIILVTQFNSFYQALLILSAVVFSTIGVLLMLMVTQQPFGIVMCGVGIISLAGIVVNNNIVLIDTYNILRRQGLTPIDAALQTGAQRLRPVLLTTTTTILGLIPMMLELNIDLLARATSLGSPSAMWWSQLSATIASGLAFATPLTLVVTPCMLIVGDRKKAQRTARQSAPVEPV